MTVDRIGYLGKNTGRPTRISVQMPQAVERHPLVGDAGVADGAVEALARRSCVRSAPEWSISTFATQGQKVVHEHLRHRHPPLGLLGLNVASLADADAEDALLEGKIAASQLGQLAQPRAGQGRQPGQIRSWLRSSSPQPTTTGWPSRAPNPSYVDPETRMVLR